MITQIEKTASPVATEVMAAPPESKLSSLSANPALAEAEPLTEKLQILEEVVIEEVSIDGMCGVY